MATRLGSLLLCLLIVCPVGGEQAAPVLHQPGERAMLTWKLPPSDANIITVSLQANGTLQHVLYCSKEVSKIEVDGRYEDRIEFLDSSIGVGDGVVTFTLSNVTEADAGRYVCVDGFGIAIIEDCGQMLVIIGKPTDVEVVGSSPPLEGEDLTLRCEATSTSLPPDHGQPLMVQWFDTAGQLLSRGDEKVAPQGELLTVRSVQRPDVGLTFSCRALDGVEEKRGVWSDRSAPYSLVPQYPPRPLDVRLDRSEAEISQGEPLHLHCSATCNPPCAISWEKEQTPDNWYIKESVNGSLYLAAVQRDLVGNFRCRAENEHGSATQNFHLVVHYTPNIYQKMVDRVEGPKANRKEGSSVTLACQFDSSPAPTVTWVKAGATRGGQGHEVKDALRTDDLEGQDPTVVRTGSILRSLYMSQLDLGQVVCADTGVYECRARNALGTGLDGDIDLHVVCMPRNTHGDLRLQEMYLLPAGNRVFIQFQVEGYPQPDVKRIISEDEQFIRTLEVTDTWSVGTHSSSTEPYLTTFDLVMTKDIDHYFDKTFYLEIENSEGIKTLAFKLREKGAPKPPRNVTVAWTEDTWVLLQLVPGFHGGKPQNFLVQYQDSESSEDAAWVTVPSQIEDAEDREEGSVETVRVEGLIPGRSYNVRVIAHNEFGNSSSFPLTVTTMATASASTDGGAIAGAVVAVIVILAIVIIVLVFVFIIRPRRRKQENQGDPSSERMLTNDDKRGADPAVLVEETKPAPASLFDTANNNANRDTSTEPLLMTSQTSSDLSPDDRAKNQDGLIYADLDLAKPKDAASKPQRNDAVNYETIDFTHQPPPPPPNPDSIELAV